jgi:small conductance mechanosensitive channel
MPSLDVNLPDVDWGPPVAALVRIAVIIVVGIVLRWLANRAIDRVVARASVINHDRPTSGERRYQRAQTIGSLLKSIATVVIVAIVFVTALDQVGVSIAPIIASAGIVGVALGFGAQNLVKDYLNGVFMILEDQYGVGDVVDLGEASGTVEAVGLRVTRLRDVNGTVWYVRNGEVLRAGNESQNWARTVLDITVSYDSDLDQVQQILQQEAEAMYADERFHNVIIEEPEVWGVERFDRDGVVVRVVLKTAPLQQWLVARTMRQRIKQRFDAAGIRIPTSFIPGPDLRGGEA